MKRELLKRKTYYQRSAVVPFWLQRNDHSEFLFGISRRVAREERARSRLSFSFYLAREHVGKNIYVDEL